MVAYDYEGKQRPFNFKPASLSLLVAIYYTLLEQSFWKQGLVIAKGLYMLGNYVIANLHCSDCFIKVIGIRDVISDVHSDTLATGVMLANTYALPLHVTTSMTFLMNQILRGLNW